MHASKLRRWHLPVLELRAFQSLAQAAHHQRLVESLLLREAGNVDRLKSRERLPRVLEVVGNRLV